MITHYQSLMLPVLEIASNREVSAKDAVSLLANNLNVTEEEINHVWPSGKSKTFASRISWAKSYLKQAGLIRYPQRGYYIATEKGRSVLSEDLQKIDNNYLKKYPEFKDFLKIPMVPETRSDGHETPKI